MTSLFEPTLQTQNSLTKSAFTPITSKPSATKNIFEPSPIQKILYYTALAQHH